jgi:hypothetical protein
MTRKQHLVCFCTITSAQTWITAVTPLRVAGQVHSLGEYVQLRVEAQDSEETLAVG